jgi:hypothetical protein
MTKTEDDKPDANVALWEPFENGAFRYGCLNFHKMPGGVRQRELRRLRLLALPLTQRCTD